MTIVEALVELQDIDGRIRELESELKDLPRRKALETARLSGVSADLQAAKASHEYAAQRVKSYEEDAKSLKDRIQQLKTTQLVFIVLETMVFAVVSTTHTQSAVAVSLMMSD